MTNHRKAYLLPCKPYGTRLKVIGTLLMVWLSLIKAPPDAGYTHIYIVLKVIKAMHPIGTGLQVNPSVRQDWQKNGKKSCQRYCWWTHKFQFIWVLTNATYIRSKALAAGIRIFCYMWSTCI